MTFSDGFPWLDENGHRWDVNRQPVWQTRWVPREWQDGAVELQARPFATSIHSRTGGTE